MTRRILFVDDEPNILNGLRRMLHAHRGEWQMDFANSGEEAIRLARDAEYDAVISDMRMPGMDGVELLQEIRELSPRTARIVLSGHAESESLMQSAFITHHYLTKPTSAEIMREFIGRTCWVEDLLAADDLKAAVGSLTELPVLPETYAQLSRLIAAEDSTIDDVAEVIEGDIGLTAKILHLTNSSLFGLPVRVESIRHATSLLGLTRIRDLVLTFELFRQFEGYFFPAGYSPAEEQRRALQCAGLARQIAPDEETADLAFMSSVLCDVGRLLLATQRPEVFGLIEEICATSDEPLCAIEREIAGADHPEIGAYLLGLWGLPYSVVEAVALHHEPSRGSRENPTLDAAAVTHIAQALVHEAEAPNTPSFLDETFVAAIGADELVGHARETIVPALFENDS